MPEILNATAIASANVTGPAFVVVPIGDGRSGWPHMGLYAKNVSKMLTAAKPHGKAVYILTPRDLGATWSKASKHNSLDAALMIVPSRIECNSQYYFIGKHVYDCTASARSTGAPAP
jgi:hypothetical protein